MEVGAGRRGKFRYQAGWHLQSIQNSQRGQDNCDKKESTLKYVCPSRLQQLGSTTMMMRHQEWQVKGALWSCFNLHEKASNSILCIKQWWRNPSMTYAGSIRARSERPEETQAHCQWDLDHISVKQRGCILFGEKGAGHCSQCRDAARVGLWNYWSERLSWSKSETASRFFYCIVLNLPADMQSGRSH